MITKTEFAQYCLEVRKNKENLPREQTFDYIYSWIKSHRHDSLSHIFNLVGLWGGRYKEDFKYQDLADIKFCDLPDEASSTLNYLDILEKL